MRLQGGKPLCPRPLSPPCGGLAREVRGTRTGWYQQFQSPKGAGQKRGFAVSHVTSGHGRGHQAPPVLLSVCCPADTGACLCVLCPCSEPPWACFIPAHTLGVGGRREAVLPSRSCCDKAAQTWWPKPAVICSLTVLEAKNLKLRPLGHHQGVGRAALPQAEGKDRFLDSSGLWWLPCPSTGGRLRLQGEHLQTSTSRSTLSSSHLLL